MIMMDNVGQFRVVVYTAELDHKVLPVTLEQIDPQHHLCCILLKSLVLALSCFVTICLRLTAASNSARFCSVSK